VHEATVGEQEYCQSAIVMSALQVAVFPDASVATRVTVWTVSTSAHPNVGSPPRKLTVVPVAGSAQLSHADANVVGSSV